MSKSRLIGATMRLSDEQRRSDRSTLDAIRGSAASPDDSIAIAVTNISAHGFAAITDRSLTLDSEMVLEAAGVRREFRVVWQKGLTIGAEFLGPLSDDELTRILSSSSSTC